MIVTGNEAAVAAAYVAARSAMQTLLKEDGKANHGTYTTKYVSLAKILEMVTPLLAAQKLVIMQEPITTEDGVGIATTILHESGARIEFVPLVMPLADRKPHAVGSALSYAKRYALTAVLGLAGDDDDDAQIAQDTYKAKAKPAPVTNGAGYHIVSPPTPGGLATNLTEDELWEPRETVKAADTLSKTQLARITLLGVDVCGKEAFEQTDATKLALWASDKKVNEVNKLSPMQADKAIKFLEAKLTEQAQQQPA